MADPFVAEIRIFGFTFAPVNWAQCNGQIMPIQQNAALFSLLGTNFGGNGQTNFGLPNLQGSAACSAGQGRGLSSRVVGQSFGSPSVTLQTTQLPSHSHTFYGRNSTSGQLVNNATAGVHLARTINQDDFTTSTTPDTTLSPQMIGQTGGGQAHANQQPYLTMNICICLTGIFPQRQ